MSINGITYFDPTYFQASGFGAAFTNEYLAQMLLLQALSQTATTAQPTVSATSSSVFCSRDPIIIPPSSQPPVCVIPTPPTPTPPVTNCFPTPTPTPLPPVCVTPTPVPTFTLPPFGPCVPITNYIPAAYFNASSYVATVPVRTASNGNVYENVLYKMPDGSTVPVHQIRGGAPVVSVSPDRKVFRT